MLFRSVFFSLAVRGTVSPTLTSGSSVLFSSRQVSRRVHAVALCPRGGFQGSPRSAYRGRVRAWEGLWGFESCGQDPLEAGARFSRRRPQRGPPGLLVPTPRPPQALPLAPTRPLPHACRLD